MITYPYQKGKTYVGSKDSYLYAVVCILPDGSVTFADIWGEPYTASRYSDALRLKREIANKACQLYWWEEKQFMVAKITLACSS